MYKFLGILGAGFIIAPFVLGYSTNFSAVLANLLIGVGLISTSLLEMIDQDKGNWEYLAAELLGLAAVVSPFALRFESQATALWTSVIVGSTAIGMAGLKLTMDEAERS